MQCMKRTVHITMYDHGHGEWSILSEQSGGHCSSHKKEGWARTCTEQRAQCGLREPGRSQRWPYLFPFGEGSCFSSSGFLNFPLVTLFSSRERVHNPRCHFSLCRDKGQLTAGEDSQLNTWHANQKVKQKQGLGYNTQVHSQLFTSFSTSSPLKGSSKTPPPWSHIFNTLVSRQHFIYK